MDTPSLIEAIRFGYGPRAGTVPAPGGLEPERLLAQLTATDAVAAEWQRPTLAERFALLAEFREGRRAGTLGKNATPEAIMNGPGLKLKTMQFADVETFVSRPAASDLGFVERLVNFWANRITVSNVSMNVGSYIQSFRDEAIRPRLAGRHADLLKATLWHPAMLVYLTQTDSTGPNSPFGLKKGKGLNENLAREFLELHSMGRGYSQTDVTELAKLLAGMKVSGSGPEMDDRRVEPGTKTILGQSYGEGPRQIDALVEYVAQRPETAESVALWLARHFISDTPPADLVQAMAKTYLDHDTELLPVYRVLLEHPAAADPARHKVRSPQEFAAASLRLVGMTGQEKGVPGFKKRGMLVPEAMVRMGQAPYKALRPDGWPEVAAGWMTPPMMAARIDWAVDLARATGDRAEPAALVDFALGDLANPMLRRAVSGAEQRWEGLAVLIASPDFSRR